MKSDNLKKIIKFIKFTCTNGSSVFKQEQVFNLA